MYCKGRSRSSHVGQNTGQFEQAAALILGDSIIGPHQIQRFFIADQIGRNDLTCGAAVISLFQTFKEKADLEDIT